MVRVLKYDWINPLNVSNIWITKGLVNFKLQNGVTGNIDPKHLKAFCEAVDVSYELVLDLLIED